MDAPGEPLSPRTGSASGARPATPPQRESADIGVPTPTKTSRSGAARGRRSRHGERRAGPGSASAGAAAADDDALASKASLAAEAKDASACAADAKDPAKPQDNAVTARLMKTKMCYFFEKGKCASLNCRYAHSAVELRNVPNLQKTKLCKSFVQDGQCKDGENCVFAHGEKELRVTDGIYKTQMCHFYERGRCLKGERCNHAHGEQDLRVPRSSTSASSTPARSRNAAAWLAGSPSTAEGAGRSSGALSSSLGSGSGSRGGGAGLSGSGAGESRSPLSPLPLAELLSESVNTQGSAAGSAYSAGGGPDAQWNAASAAAAAGLLSPDFSSILGFTAPVSASSLCSPWNAPWLTGAYGVDGNPTAMQCPPSGCDTAGLTGSSLAWGAQDSGRPVLRGDSSQEVPAGSADLGERLANLDAVVAGLSADVRTLTAGDTWPVQPYLMQDKLTQPQQQPQRTVHRI